MNNAVTWGEVLWIGGGVVVIIIAILVLIWFLESLDFSK